MYAFLSKGLYIYHYLRIEVWQRGVYLENKMAGSNVEVYGYVNRKFQQKSFQFAQFWCYKQYVCLIGCLHGVHLSIRRHEVIMLD